MRCVPNLRALGATLAILSAGTVSVAGFAALEAFAPPPPGVGLDLINERCGFCHTTAQTLEVRKTPENWAVTVQSMIDRGAELTPEEQQEMVKYLADNRALDAGVPVGGVVEVGIAQPTSP